jgi:hypothetical protein
MAWGTLAEVCAKYVNKGARLYVAGRLHTLRWEDAGGDGVGPVGSAVLSSRYSRHAYDRLILQPLGAEHRLVRRVQEYLAAHDAEPITLDHRAHLLPFSAVHVLRVFRTATGLSSTRTCSTFVSPMQKRSGNQATRWHTVRSRLGVLTKPMSRRIFVVLLA